MPKLIIPQPSIQLAISSEAFLNNSSYFFDSDNVGKITMGYENATNGRRFGLKETTEFLEERARLNEAYDSNDTGQLFSHPCKKIVTDNKAETRCQVGDARATRLGDYCNF